MKWRKKKKSIVEEVFVSSFTTYVMATLAYAVGPMVDGAVIGRCLGVDAFAAYGLIWPAVLIYSLVGGILAGGARNLYVERISDYFPAE